MSSGSLIQKTDESIFPFIKFNMREQGDQIDQVDQVDQVDQIDQIDQVDQIDQIDQIKYAELENINSAQIIKLMKQSFILNLVYEYIIKKILNKTNNMIILKKNIKIVIFVLCLFMLSGFIGLMNYYLTSLLFAYASLKCVLWFFDNYNDRTRSVEDSAISVLEYFIVPIITSLISFILLFNPFSILTLIGNIFNIVFGIIFITHKGYRQQLCIFIKNFIINKEFNVPEGELYKFLQTLCLLIENFYRMIFNCLHNFSSTYNKLVFSTDIVQSIHILCRDISDTDIAKPNMAKLRHKSGGELVLNSQNMNKTK
jgi:hypothetical protein